MVVVSETREEGFGSSELGFHTRLKCLQDLNSDRGSYGGGGEGRLLSRLSLAIGPQKVPTDVPCTAQLCYCTLHLQVEYNFHVLVARKNIPTRTYRYVPMIPSLHFTSHRSGMIQFP